MKRIAMICPPAAGHIFPSLALASSLRDQGHEVTFFQVAKIGSSLDLITQAGFPAIVYGSSELQLLLLDAYKRLGEQSGLRALRTTIRIVRERVNDTLKRLPKILRDEKIDCALIDCLMPGAAAVASMMSMPFASVSNALVLNRDPAVPPCFTTWTPDHYSNRLRNRLAYTAYSLATRSILGAINEFRKRHGAPVIQSLDEIASETLHVSQQPDFLTFQRDVPVSGLHFCGPFINGRARASISFPWEKLSGNPIVYLSLGTLQNRTKDIFRTISDACSTLGVDLVISTGGVDHNFDPHLPGNPIVVRFAPQLQILQRASLFVTHAGLNSALESIAAGVSMVAVPIANDQPGVAARLEYHGLGKLLTQRNLTAATARMAIQEALKDRQLLENVGRAQSQLQRMDGCGKATQLIERLVLGADSRTAEALRPEKQTASPI